MNRYNSRTSFGILGIILFILVWVGVVIFQRKDEAASLRRETRENQILSVSLIKAKPSVATQDIILPGTILAWHETAVFARSQGYVKAWYVDIGSKVKKGDLLAKIETPEVNEQLREAEADLKATLAQNSLAQITASRWVGLVQTDFVSQQATDEKVDNARTVAADVESKCANRDRFKQLVEFGGLIAPFDGIVSDRRTDLGALINIGSNPSEQQPLFRIVQTNPLRLYIKIPQAYASLIKPNMNVKIEFTEHPGKTFAARLLDTAHAIDPTSRTLLSQFLVNNEEGILFPGAYTSVHFSIPSPAKTVRLPINTLIFRKEGLQVASLDKKNCIVLKEVTIHKDFGNYVDIATGVNKGEELVINPSDAIYEGQEVRVSGTH